MTARNSILLMVKQSPGITYNFLLGKIASDFGSINSARASLSRTLKDGVSLGLLKKRDNFYFITDKGNSTISFEMKNKLLMKLNNLVYSEKIDELDSIVEQLHTVIERSKNDADLLKDAKHSANFDISDLTEINSKVNSKIKHLTYLSKVLSKQLESLKELNFNDSLVLSKEKISVKKLVSFFNFFEAEDFSVECSETVFSRLAPKFSIKTKNPPFSLKKPFLSDFLSFIISTDLNQTEIVKIYFSSIQIRISSSVLVSGPFSEIKKLRKLG